MKRLAAHRFHRLDALEVKPPPPVEGLSAHTVPAAKVFHAYPSRKLAQDLLSDFVCNLHGLKTKPGRVYAFRAFLLYVDLCQ